MHKDTGELFNMIAESEEQLEKLNKAYREGNVEMLPTNTEVGHVEVLQRKMNRKERMALISLLKKGDVSITDLEKKFLEIREG